MHGPAKKVYSLNRGWTKVKHEHSDWEVEAVWNVALTAVPSGVRNNPTWVLDVETWQSFAMGIGVLAPCSTKYFCFGCALVTQNQAMTLLPNWTYSYVLWDKISVGVSRQLVSCHQGYNASTTHLLTADNNSQREQFYRITWQYVRDWVNLPIFALGKI